MAATFRNLTAERDSKPTANDPPEDVVALKAVRGLLLITTILIATGLTMLYSASYGTAGLKYFRNQLIWVALGIIGAVTVFVIGYRQLAKQYKLWLVAALAGLIACLFFDEINGAKRWIQLGFFSIQPSEFAKVAMALYVAKYCTDFPRTFSLLFNRRGLIYPFGVTALAIIGAILMGQDLGTTVLVAAMTFLTLLAAGLYWRYLLVIPAVIGAAALYIINFDPMRLARATSFMNPEQFKTEDGYQLWNSLMALGSGSWCGIGFMKSRMKAKYLPEAHTDFVVAIVGEELGFIAILLLLLLYTLFGYFALKIALNARSRLGTLLGFALPFGILLQAAINLLVVSGSAPTKGMPAPFLSYGGSNMIACLIGVGLLVSIAMDTIAPDYQEELQNKFLPWRRKDGSDAKREN